MNIISRLHHKPGSFFGRLLTTGVSIWLLGVVFSPVLAATPSPVVDQAPLIIQKPLPPNITLMLDDSGSMAWDVMPDWSSLGSQTADALVSSDVNGVYFNPGTTYTPPLKADGSLYPNAAFASALVNGFNAGSRVVDLSVYDGSSDSSREGYVKSSIAYSIGAGTDGYSASTCGNYDGTSTKYPGYCFDSDDTGSSDFKDSGNGNYYYYYRCNSHQDTYNSDMCYPHSFFTYTTRNVDNTLTRHYVAKSTGDCTAAGLPTAVCDESMATQQNVANWFSYYHTRMLMAKSGVMNAFSSIDPAYRIGFGSINGSNASPVSLGSDYYSFQTSAKGGIYKTGLAIVKPFDATQKSNLWSWLVGTSPKGYTPLRGALDAVGQYYKTDQPWQAPGSTGTTELACRQSYTILTTDGFWNGDTPSGIGNVDLAPATLTGPNNRTYTYTPASPYSDDQSDTLADVAMKYWITDLRTSAANEVPTSTEDPAFWQHMTTFTLGLGFSPVDGQGTTAPSDDVALASTDEIFAWANGGTAIPGFIWPAPSKDNINNIADLEHAAVNGHGGFYSATSPVSFTAGIKAALARVSGRVGTGASLAANSTQLTTGAFAYQANYYTGSWMGDLKAIAVNPNNGTLATTLTWSAADPKVMPTYDKRNIWTYNPAAATGSQYVAFKNTSSTDATTGITNTSPAALSPAELTRLGSDATAQQNMINYLRGDASLEKPKTGGVYRTRTTPLGDIVNSQPVFVGQPDPNQFNGEVFAGSDTFGTYAATTRNNLIFVAANDGMLHAFDAGTTAVPNGTGTEVYAYLPAAVITTNTSTTGRTTGDLATLADPDYGTSTAPHQFFNDGELTVGDVYFGSAWHTVVVGTTGRGLAKAVYALDVTNPDPTKITLLWERSAAEVNGKYTDGNSKYIGQMTGKPVIAQTGDGVWSVLIGNGYNSTAGVAALLQFNIASGVLSVYQAGTTSGNGLAAPAVWMDNPTNGISTMAFAGDAQGGVWSFALNQTTNPVKKLFQATDGTTAQNAQPITSGMLVGKNPVTKDLWLFFGTGQYLNSADLDTRTTQSWYGLIVQSTTSGLAANGTNNITRNGNLVHRSIIAETPGTPEVLNADGTVKTAAIAPARAVTALPDPSGMSGKSGWFIDLLSPTSSTDGTGTVTYTSDQIHEGERIVTPNQFQGNQLLATTRIPQAVDLCNPSGRGWIMAVDPFTGTNPKLSFFDLNGDGMINQPADYIMVNGKPVATSGIGFSSLPNNPIFVGGSMLVSFDNGSATSIKTSGTSNTLQRVSWRELIAQ